MQNDDTLTAMTFAGFSAYETWTRYCSMGGCTGYFEVDAYLHGLYGVGREDADLVSRAVNGLIDGACPADEAGFCRAPYSWTSNSEQPSYDAVLDGAIDVMTGEMAGDLDWLDDGPILVEVDDLVGPHSPDTFGSMLLTGLDVSSLSGRPGIPLPPGAPLELLREVLDSGIIGRIVSRERQ
ncbi:hypothetical protein RCH21_000875 [Arthrobacter sp. PL16]|uniref:hypothetical protein n=1 Tax=Arthrobacter sp. PL16 TaxID=3071720 RepID=UPI002DF78548|nr:hypothetical protein [Arthrobacter sp. PL16]